MLRCYRNHSAFNSHNLPSDLRYYLSVQYVAVSQQPSHTNPWCSQIRKLPRASSCTYGLGTVSFHSISFEVYFAAVSAQGFARASPPFGGARFHHRYGLLATHLAIVFSVNSAYLPGLSLHVPRRLWKVRDSNPRAFQLTTNRRSCLSPLSQPSLFLPLCSLLHLQFLDFTILNPLQNLIEWI